MRCKYANEKCYFILEASTAEKVDMYRTLEMIVFTDGISVPNTKIDIDKDLSVLSLQELISLKYYIYTVIYRALFSMSKVVDMLEPIIARLDVNISSKLDDSKQDTNVNNKILFQRKYFEHIEINSIEKLLDIILDSMISNDQSLDMPDINVCFDLFNIEPSKVEEMISFLSSILDIKNDNTKMVNFLTNKVRSILVEASIERKLTHILSKGDIVSCKGEKQFYNITDVTSVGATGVYILTNPNDSANIIIKRSDQIDLIQIDPSKLTISKPVFLIMDKDKSKVYKLLGGVSIHDLEFSTNSGLEHMGDHSLLKVLLQDINDGSYIMVSKSCLLENATVSKY